MLPADRERAALALREAERSRGAIRPLIESYPDLTVEDAYAIQLINIDDRVKSGAVVRGHKVGLSSAAMQKMMGVDQPDYGHLLDDMFVFEDDVIALDTMIQTRVEVEVAFVLGDTLPARGCNVADVLRCTAFVMPALEIIDSRISDWKISIADTIADNASSARVVLGGKATPIDRVDPRAIGATLRRNGEIVATGSAGAVLGNPVTAVAWLANTVQEFGVRLEAGHVVLPGSCTRAFDVFAGDHVHAEFDVLGGVGVRFAADSIKRNGS